jgi:hypothetical protein
MRFSRLRGMEQRIFRSSYVLRQVFMHAEGTCPLRRRSPSFYRIKLAGANLEILYSVDAMGHCSESATCIPPIRPSTMSSSFLVEKMAGTLT